jgi:DeoR/GlpR family transcriptional regulator of sugar metabolism
VVSRAPFGPSSLSERHERLVDVVTDRGFARVSELSRLVGVSEVTIRSDLRSLDSMGVLRRVRGGAETNGTRTLRPGPDWSATSVGPMAAALARPGDRIVLDGSPQTVAVASGLLQRRDLSEISVLAHNLRAAGELAQAPERFTVEVPAGAVRPSGEIVRAEPLDVDIASFDLAFIGCDGITAERVSVAHAASADTLRGVLGAGKRVVLIVAASAVGVAAGTVVCETQELDACIATGEVPEQFAAELMHRGLQFLATA